jgi:hypothetical protein
VLSTIVLYSFAYLLLLSLSLFAFIFLRRLLIESQERRDRAVYELIEKDLLEVLTASAPRPAALALAAKHRARSKVLKRVLVQYREALIGRSLEPLKTIFEGTIRRRCLRDLRSPILATRLQNVRLFIDFSRPDEALHLVKLLHDKPIVRLAALQALTGIASGETLGQIFDLFERDPEPNLYAYSNVLYSLGPRIEPFVRTMFDRALPPEKTGLLIEIAGRLLLRGLYPDVVFFARHENKELRIRAARTLGRLLVPGSTRTLMDLAADPAWEVQAQALRSLGALRDWRTVPVLVKGLFSPQWHVRYNAGYALAAFGMIGIVQLREISRQNEDRFAADMAAMVLDAVVLTGGVA